MKKGIHPAYTQKKFICSCGNERAIGTTFTRAKEIHTNICGLCHPFYTGKSKRTDATGRIEKFNKRLG